jgi:indolepyruvate ferredoxin oxidoreductase
MGTGSAGDAMTTTREYVLGDRYAAEDARVVLTGVQALARVPLDVLRADRRAGLRTAAFISGYPGSPLGGLDLELARHRDVNAAEGFDIVHRPGLNEELAATAVMGSQTADMYGSMRYDGVVGFWYGKAPGVDRAADALRHAQFFGVNRTSGAVAYVGDDPACKSSSLPGASEQLLAALRLPVLCPGNPQEVLDLGRHAVQLSRATSLWTAMKIVTVVADGTGTALVHPDRVRIAVVLDDDGRPLGRDSASGLGLAGVLEDERHIAEVRLENAVRYARANSLNALESDPPDPWLGIVAPSHTFEVVLDALARTGLGRDDLERLGVRLLRMRMISPLDQATVRDFATGLDTVLVVEEKGPFLETEIRSCLYGRVNAPAILGKRGADGSRLIPTQGALDVAAVREQLRSVLLGRLPESELRPAPGAARVELPLLARVPAFCSGCPHNTGTKVPKDSLVSAGIGCSSMAMWMDPDRVGSVRTYTQMGGEGSHWIGVEPFVEADHMFQNLGDGTYFHSAQLAVQASVAAGANITYKLLYNTAVAMTGGQDAPGALPVPAVAANLLRQGVRKIIVTTEDTGRYRRAGLPRGVECWDRSRIIEAQEVLRATPGVTVLIHDQQCAAEARRLRKRGRQAEPSARVVIATRVCEGCGDCGAKSACLSVEPVETEFGRKTAIDQASCNKDYSCLDGDCPSFITVTPRKRARTRRARTKRAKRAGAGPPVVPDPPRPVDPVDTRIRMPGIGGSGVVTVNQILATAAELDGRFVSGLDQTGLAQKGGTVVSDLRVTSEPSPGSGAGVRGALDLYLVFDVLAGTGPMVLAPATPDRTIAVVSTSVVPTMAMVSRPEVGFPAMDALRAAIDGQTRADHNRYLDAREVAKRLIGTPSASNILMLGIAIQAGLVPVSVASVRHAIELNGVAVDANLVAFEWGRAWEHDRRDVERASGPGAVEDPALPDTITRRAADLHAYQGPRLVARYLALIEATQQAERTLDTPDTALTDAVARGFHKLLAYKDEYEVARLLLDPDVRAQVVRDSGLDDPVISYNLHPPFLRALGMQRKIRLGPWANPAFRALRAARRLRGTPFDPFGYAAIRRTERALGDEYEAAIRAALSRLDAGNWEHALELASAPDLVRGYEDIKTASVDRFRAALADFERQQVQDSTTRSEEVG